MKRLIMILCAQLMGGGAFATPLICLSSASHYQIRFEEGLMTATILKDGLVPTFGRLTCLRKDHDQETVRWCYTPEVVDAGYSARLFSKAPGDQLEVHLEEISFFGAKSLADLACEPSE